MGLSYYTKCRSILCSGSGGCELYCISREVERGGYCCILITELALLIKDITYKIISVLQRLVDTPVCQLFKLSSWGPG